MRFLSKVAGSFLAALFLAVTICVPEAAAEEPGLVVTTVITDISLEGDQVRIGARVSNTGNVPAFGVHVELWRSQTPIQDLNGFKKVESEPPFGRTLYKKPGKHVVSVKAQTDLPFNPGEVADISLTATLKELEFNESDVVYPIGLSIFGNSDGSSNYSPLGQPRTFLPIPGNKRATYTAIVLLRAEPSKVYDSVFVNDSLAKQLAGSLEQLLVAAGGNSFLVDPALIDEVSDMADGYSILTPEGLVEGTASKLAESWLQRFHALNPANGAQTLFANPDITVDSSILEQAVDANNQVTDPLLEQLPLIALPNTGQVESKFLIKLTNAKPAAVLATNSTTPNKLRNADDGLRIIAANTPSAITLADRQIRLAKLLLENSEPEIYFVADTAQLLYLNDTIPDWALPFGLDRLLASSFDGKASFTKTQHSGLSPEQRSTNTRIANSLKIYAELVADATDIPDTTGLLARANADIWASNSTDYQAYAAAIKEHFGEDPASNIALDVTEQFLMSSNDNAFPVSVTNRLGVRIRVKISVIPENTQRLQVEDTNEVIIAPAVSQTISIHPQARSNGIVMANVFVVTSKGTILLGPQKVTIDVTNLGFIGWVIIGSSAAVLAITTILRVRKGANDKSANGKSANSQSANSQSANGKSKKSRVKSPANPLVNALTDPAVEPLVNPATKPAADPLPNTAANRAENPDEQELSTATSENPDEQKASQ